MIGISMLTVNPEAAGGTLTLLKEPKVRKPKNMKRRPEGRTKDTSDDAAAEAPAAEVTETTEATEQTEEGGE